MFHLEPSNLSGCFEIRPKRIVDHRGCFVKVYQKDEFINLGLETNFVEEYYSHSHKDVIRGLHFQAPPMDHVKIVYCTHGSVFDVLLDLRKGSPSYGKTSTFRLSSAQGNYLYIPKGVAHGFCATSAIATLVYKVSSIYAPQHDQGVLWSSVDIDWPTRHPIVSERDASFCHFDSFESPFE
ncbi:MAG: dTDP-4-dehydrorhamnose 3,5-epimerase [Kordiimonas sp.]